MAAALFIELSNAAGVTRNVFLRFFMVCFSAHAAWQEFLWLFLCAVLGVRRTWQPSF